MKTIFKISACLLLISYSVFAQKQEIDLSSITKIEIYYIYGDINIEGTTSNKLKIDIISKREVPKDFNSLKFELKESNSDLDLNIETIGNILRIYPSSIQAKLTDYNIIVPKNIKVKINNVGGDNNKTWSPFKYKSLLTGKINVTNLTDDIQINGSYYTILNLINITGPIVAESNSGNINIDFSSLSQSNPSSIKTNSGIITITLPQSAKCNVFASSLTGKFQSEINLDKINVESPDPEVRSKMEVTNDEADTKTKGQINGGGVNLYIRSLTGDISLKSK
ncbi:DUF4097 family beta strand repeat protein [Candidatus Peregrinibacteria bacterium]|nr:DUF4097 family beta strand repeat protein [Candidatus Peregrinibacteria bacterium]